MKTFNYIIVDDDIQAHNVLNKLMKIHDNFKCIGNYYNVVTATKAIKEIKPDLIFLDIEMPDLDGFVLFKYIEKETKVIITTSHRELGANGFDSGALDYICKPIFPDRLFEAVNRFISAIERDKSYNKDKNDIKNAHKLVDFIFASREKERKTIRIDIKDIFYITKSGNHIVIYTDNDGPFYKIDSLKEVIETLPSNEFHFVNQSYIFNVNKIESVDGENIIIDKKKNENIKISNELKKDLKKFLKSSMFVNISKS